MKKYLLMFISCLMTIHLTAQKTKIKQTVKTIVQQRDIYLNGGARTYVGGKSRTTIPIYLPENTKSWYYSFTTSPGESGTKNLNLFAQFSTLSLDPFGITKSAISKIHVPDGSESIDVYLLDQVNSDLFINKSENTSYYREGSITNTRNALVQIEKSNHGNFYIGLKNPSTFNGINIKIEVVAVIEEVEEQTDEQSEAITFGGLGWKAFERGDYDKCISLSKKALALDNSLTFIHFNLAISYLIKGINEDAIQEYTKAISIAKKSIYPKENITGAIEDLDKYMNLFPSKSDAQDILDLLKEEIKAY